MASGRLSMPWPLRVPLLQHYMRIPECFDQIVDAALTAQAVFVVLNESLEWSSDAVLCYLKFVVSGPFSVMPVAA